MCILVVLLHVFGLPVVVSRCTLYLSVGGCPFEIVIVQSMYVDLVRIDVRNAAHIDGLTHVTGSCDEPSGIAGRYFSIIGVNVREKSTFCFAF